MVSFYLIINIIFLDYKNDPFSNGNPGDTICARFDLEKKHPSAGGCYDTKVKFINFIINIFER